MKPTQEEPSMAQFLMEAQMEEFPISDMGYSATHEPAAVVDVDMVWTEMEELVIEKSPQTGANLHLWRKASLAINAVNRMRLVLESIRAMDVQTANQTAADITSLFWSPPFDEALQAELPNCSSYRSTKTVEHSCRVIGTSIIPVFHPSYEKTLSGKLRLVFESVEPVEPGNEHQIVDRIFALVTGKTCNIVGASELPDLLNQIPATICAETGNVSEWIEELMSGPVPEGDEECQFAFDDIGVVSSSNSSTEFVTNLDHAAQSRVNNPSTPDTTTSVHLLAHPPMVQHFPVMGTSCDRTPYQTASENTSIWEGDDGMETVWPNQECRRNPDSEPQMQLRKDQEFRQWNELIADLIERITGEIDKIDKASDRSKLKSMSDQAYDASTKLVNVVVKFKGNLETFFKELKKLFEKCSTAGQQHLLRALVEKFEHHSLNLLLTDTEGLSKKLNKLGKELSFRQNLVNKIAQNCASTLSTVVGSFLTKQRSNFVPVTDFTKLAIDRKILHFGKFTEHTL